MGYSSDLLNKTMPPKVKYLIQSLIRSKYTIRIIFSVILLVSTGEIFARYYLGLGTPPLSVTHPSIEYMYRPNQDVYRFGHHFITNQYGMRSPPLNQNKNSQELRVMVFGDSVVNGGSPTDQTELATSILKDRLTKLLNKNVFVGNISAGSWGPGNWLAYAKEYGFFHADIIVLVLSSHDYNDNPTFAPLDGTTQPTENPSSALIEGLEIYLPRYLPHTSNNPSQSNKPPAIESYAGTQDESNNEKEVQKALKDLKSFLELAKSNSKTVLVFQHYEQPEIESGRPKPGYQLIKITCEKLGITPTSLEPYFRKSIEGGIDPYRDFIHPNQVGQKLIAEAIAAKISQ
jgi:lysophospholipase L1-like esterase